MVACPWNRRILAVCKIEVKDEWPGRSGDVNAPFAALLKLRMYIMLLLTENDYTIEGDYNIWHYVRFN